MSAGHLALPRHLLEAASAAQKLPVAHRNVSAKHLAQDIRPGAGVCGGILAFNRILSFLNLFFVAFPLGAVSRLTDFRTVSRAAKAKRLRQEGCWLAN